MIIQAVRVDKASHVVTRPIVAFFFILLLANLFANQSHAQSKNRQLEVELITISPGEYYWEAFGHSALRIKNAYDDRLFGFGYFNFNEENFFLNFAKGNMRYFLGVDVSSYELQDYQSQGRTITSQPLALSKEQKTKLLNKLIFLSRAENRFYHYDYFLSNCTSKIRDLLDEVTEGEISNQLKAIQTDQSWSSLTFPAPKQAWMNLGMAIIYGLPAFQSKNQWQLSVFPEVFSNDLAHIETKTHWNKAKNILFQATNTQAQSQIVNGLATHYAMLSVVGVLLLLLSLSLTQRWTLIVWLLVQSVLGSLLLVVWFFTQHHIAAWNLNLLLFSPLAFVLILPKFAHNKKLIGLFAAMNSVWFISSLFLTTLYLVGFCLLNLLACYYLSEKPLLKTRSLSENRNRSEGKLV